MAPPAPTGSGESVCESCRSATGLTVVGALAVLFEALGSPVVDETVAVLVMLGAAPAPGLTTSATITSFAAPALTVPTLQLTVAVPEHVPWPAVAETNV